MSRYQWREGARLSLDAQLVGEHLELLANDAPLTPEAILADARARHSPLHPYFEWSDTKAADAYRLAQARGLVRAVVVVIERPEVARIPIKVRAFSSLDNEGTRQYVQTTRAFSEEGLRRQLLASAQRELTAFKHKYAKLQELAEILEAIDTLRLDFEDAL